MHRYFFAYMLRNIFLQWNSCTVKPCKPCNNAVLTLLCVVLVSSGDGQSPAAPAGLLLPPRAGAVRLWQRADGHEERVLLRRLHTRRGLPQGQVSSEDDLCDAYMTSVLMWFILELRLVLNIHYIALQVIGVWWWVFVSSSAFTVTPEVLNWD